MNYMIIHNGEVFYTQWYDLDNNYIDGMVVVNMQSGQYTSDGNTWQFIEIDNL